MKKLKDKLHQIDGSGYKAYKSIRGNHRGNWFNLHIDYVQPDPFANPSRIRVEISKDTAKYKREWITPQTRRIAFEDFFSREINKNIKKANLNRRGTGKSGLISIDSPGQEILPRTSVKVTDERIEFRLSLGLPAKGRRVLGRNAYQMLCEDIPYIIKESLFKYDGTELQDHLKLSDQQETIRNYLKENNYISFIANDSILPRKSGVSNSPLENSKVVPFKSPKSFEIQIPIPYGNPLTGMAIPEGISIVIGGGYHGKSTVLNAIERGVYNHIKGDGREYVITNSTAFKIRAEDGRRVEKVNISPFISNLPYNKDTTRFSSEDASGSTSQASNIIEALEMKTEVLLIDEDTSATNFMIRDSRMQELVSKEKEPITPFIDKVRQLYNDYKVSTILVIGGSGDYFEVADNVIMMDEYVPVDVTSKAKNILAKSGTKRTFEGGPTFGSISNRVVLSNSFNAYKGKREKISARGLHTILYGKNKIDLLFLEQLVDPSQTRAIANMIKYISDNLADNSTILYTLINQLYEKIDKEGLDIISPYQGQHPGEFALPRKYELAAAINRLRTLEIE
ncbi:MAG: ATPase [Firmicutes bacterium]|nr:ATPase [Bacillota bacterium]